jgi:hypothetical protein
MYNNIYQAHLWIDMAPAAKDMEAKMQISDTHAQKDKLRGDASW